jgi:hypothetical protein
LIPTAKTAHSSLGSRFAPLLSPLGLDAGRRNAERQGEGEDLAEKEALGSIGCAHVPARRWVQIPEGQEELPPPRAGFTILPRRRWVVERTFLWTEQNRTMSKTLREADDHERGIRL